MDGVNKLANKPGIVGKVLLNETYGMFLHTYRSFLYIILIKEGLQ
ncbi:MAG: hypothetical protein PWQ96_973 [Clostridia bacterium]|jgi:hypothetical protein|nr:hypothetical protein [Clostridiales bacterium]MDK2985331.1 hypothetical protein [Clostridia bacterium]